MTKQETSEIAETIIRQLGGRNGLIAMIGANNFKHDENGALTFDIKARSKVKHINISLNLMDLYDVTFYSRSWKPRVLENVYADVLKSIIEKETGLYLSL